MRRKRTSESGVLLARLVVAFMLGTAALSLAFLSFAASSSSEPTAADLATAVTPTFGHPVISGLGGNGFEQDLRVD